MDREEMTQELKELRGKIRNRMAKAEKYRIESVTPDYIPFWKGQLSAFDYVMEELDFLLKRIVEEEQKQIRKCYRCRSFQASVLAHRCGMGICLLREDRRYLIYEDEACDDFGVNPLVEYVERLSREEKAERDESDVN